MFIGLGAMKCGTTWTSQYLKDHPDVFHSPINEMNFFNRQDRNELDGPLPKHWRRMYQEILLKEQRAPQLRKSQFEKLKAIAELDRMRSTDDYLSYFDARIANEQIFGEICPQYWGLSSSAYRRIVDMGIETKFLFFMRDPTERLASHFQHRMRSREFDVDEATKELCPGKSAFDRSNYMHTLRNFESSGVKQPLALFIYEDMFTTASIARLCDFLEIKRMPADFDRQVNVSLGMKVTADQKLRIREKLDPVYRELAVHFGDKKPVSWKWSI